MVFPRMRTSSSVRKIAVRFSLRELWRSPRHSSRPFVYVLSLTLFVLTVPGRGRAQATAEYAGATSAIGSTAAKPKSNHPIFVPTNPRGDAFPHLPAQRSSQAEKNRSALEERAGKDAAKLLLRSTPGGARIWIDGLFVGTTPMLLLLAPGSYQVEMRGDRMETGEQRFGLLPGETRSLVMNLKRRYPARLILH